MNRPKALLNKTQLSLDNSAFMYIMVNHVVHAKNRFHPKIDGYADIARDSQI